MSEAFNYANELKQLEKDKLITLSPEQKAIITKLKKRQKKPFIQGIIKNLRLNDIRTSLVSAAILTHSSFVTQLATKKNMSEKNIRKLFDSYIKARGKEKNLQQEAAELSALQKEPKITQSPDSKKVLEKFKSINAKRLEKTKKKIEKIETQHPDLRTTLEKDVEAYTTASNKILQELEKAIVKALKKRK